MAETACMEVSSSVHLVHLSRLTYQRLLLGTLPAEKTSWKDEARKQRDNYYVRLELHMS